MKKAKQLNKVRNEALHKFLTERRKASGAHDSKKGRGVRRVRAKAESRREIEESL
jgi:hypothetical protein